MLLVNYSSEELFPNAHISYRFNKHMCEEDQSETGLCFAALLWGAVHVSTRWKTNVWLMELCVWVIYRQAAGAKHFSSPSALHALLLLYCLWTTDSLWFLPSIEWKMVRSTFTVHYNQQGLRKARSSAVEKHKSVESSALTSVPVVQWSENVPHQSHRSLENMCPIKINNVSKRCLDVSAYCY